MLSYLAPQRVVSAEVRLGRSKDNDEVVYRCTLCGGIVTKTEPGAAWPRREQIALDDPPNSLSSVLSVGTQLLLPTLPHQAATSIRHPKIQIEHFFRHASGLNTEGTSRDLVTKRKKGVRHVLSSAKGHRAAGASLASGFAF